MAAGDVIVRSEGDPEERWLFWCPGCRCAHSFLVPRWSFNGNIQAPTFSPSLKVQWTKVLNESQPVDYVCHLFVTNGKINFCADCSHELKGQTVDMVPWDEV